MKLGLHIFLFIGMLSPVLFSQTQTEEREGTVTFVSSQYIYVKFEDMAGINTGDTLYIRPRGVLKPALQIEFTSSKSVAAVLLNGEELKVNDKLIAVVESIVNDIIKEDTASEIINNIQPTGEVIPKVYKKKSSRRKTGISGRFSIQSQSSFSNNEGSIDYQRWRYTLALDADRIGESDLSFSSYLNFNYRADDWNNVTSDIWKNFKIYDLAFKYEFNETMQVVLGRHRNRNISNVGSIDGVQLEKRFGGYYAGAVVGYRPDFSDLSFNSDLLEYGGYFGRSDTLGDGTMNNNLAFMQQTNNSKTDRRFIYLQHSNNILENTYFFASSEIDLYKKILEDESSELILTSIFFSFRYSPARFFSATLSYDARKNVVYYETYKSFIDSLFENETRQGLNLRTNFRLINNLHLGLNSGYRFRNGDIKPTRNFGGYLSYTLIPIIESSISVSYNKLFTNYVESSVAGVRISRNLFNNMADFSISYRKSDYELINSSFNSSQNIFSVDISTRISRILSFTLSYEGVFEENRTSGRIFAGVISRF